jgi:hypothetical protein
MRSRIDEDLADGSGRQMEGGLYDTSVTHPQECSMVPVAEDPRSDGLLIGAGRQMMIALSPQIVG